jgi:putative ABC transport system substrate-binding protein
MMKTIFSILLIIALSGLPLPSAALQDSPKLPRIGVLTPWSDPSEGDNKRYREAFFLGLKELGYVEEKNIHIEWRYGDAKLDRLHHFAEDLVRLNPSVIIATGTTAIVIAMKVTQTVPIVMVSGGDPVNRGFVKSLSVPGGNITGFSSSTADLSAKRIELLKETFLTTRHVVVLNADRARRRAQNYVKAGKALGLQVETVRVLTPEDLSTAFAKIEAIRPDALVTVRNFLTILHAEEIAAFALKNRLPAIYEARRFVTSSGLMSYGIDYTTSWRHAAIYVDKILKGANPGNIPVEPPQLELVINLKTAEKIGVTIPPEILLEANEVIK